MVKLLLHVAGLLGAVFAGKERLGMMLSDIAVIGMAVMGENLALNMERNGFRVTVYDRTYSRTEAFTGTGRGSGGNFYAARTYEELVSSLKRPAKIMLMISAGSPVDSVIDALTPLLSPGDIIIDGGNSHFKDTIRRAAAAAEKGILYVGTGVSGGEEGALKGPSLMPGCSPEAWEAVKPIFLKICAKAEGEPCCDLVGENGAGHFVKMVHNGIEYGDMQLICEVYSIMKHQLGMSNAAMRQVFEEWNRGRLESYLIQITADILAYRESDGSYLLDNILDAAGQKGTGKWASQTALDEGVPLTLISEAVFARCLSAEKEMRAAASKEFPCITEKQPVSLEDLESALYAAKLISYAQGFSLMKAAAQTYGWHLNFGAIALMWRGGCIIRSAFLGKIRDAYLAEPELDNLLFAPYFREVMMNAEGALRRVCAAAMLSGVHVPALTSALEYFDGIRSERLPANLLQAQRDLFGAHTYERIDAPRGEHFHTLWNKE